MRLLAAVLAASAVALAGCGSDDNSTSSGESTPRSSVPGDSPSAASVEVPDVIGEDGATAVSAVEDVDLVATLEGISEDPAFDPNRDPEGCTVEDQDPAAGDQAASGDEVTLMLDCRQTDWDNQEGAVWDDFNTSYQQGFDDGCSALFGETPNGSLYEGDTEYTEVDCPSAPDASDSADLPNDFPDDPQADGSALGCDDGCDALFNDVAFVDELYNGTQTYTADDCKALSDAAPGSSATGTPCGGGLYVGPQTTCAFAENVRTTYNREGGGDITIVVRSPVTGKDYTLACSDGETHVCIANTGAKVYFE